MSILQLLGVNSVRQVTQAHSQEVQGLRVSVHAALHPGPHAAQSEMARGSGKGGHDLESNLVCVCPVCHRVLHGEYEYTRDFPFDKVTAEDAVYYYLADY